MSRSLSALAAWALAAALLTSAAPAATPAELLKALRSEQERISAPLIALDENYSTRLRALSAAKKKGGDLDAALSLSDELLVFPDGRHADPAGNAELSRLQEIYDKARAERITKLAGEAAQVAGAFLTAARVHLGKDDDANPAPGHDALALLSTVLENSPSTLFDIRWQQPTKDKPYTNSLGMKFVPVPGIDGLVSIWETRVRDFETFAKATDYPLQPATGNWSDEEKKWGKYGNWKDTKWPQTPDHPVACVGVKGAKAFCEWLTKSSGIRTRLPTDAEWGLAAGLAPDPADKSPAQLTDAAPKQYPWGESLPPPQDFANYSGEESHVKEHIRGYKDRFRLPAPVGSYPANKYGIHDLWGNMWEICDTLHTRDKQGLTRRGGSWSTEKSERLLRLGARKLSGLDERSASTSFRVIIDHPEGAPVPILPSARTQAPSPAPGTAITEPARPARAASNIQLVVDGKLTPDAATEGIWKPAGDRITSEGEECLIRSKWGFVEGDYLVKAELVLNKPFDGTSTTLHLGGPRLVFDSSNKTTITLRDGGLKDVIGPASGKVIKVGEPFKVRVERRRGAYTVSVRGKKIAESKGPDVALRPLEMRTGTNVLSVLSLECEGRLVERPIAPRELFPYRTLSSYAFEGLSLRRSSNGLAAGFRGYHGDTNGVVGVSVRHQGQWSKTKQVLKTYSDTIRGDGKRDNVSSHALAACEESETLVCLSAIHRNQQQIYRYLSTDGGITWAKKEELTKFFRGAGESVWFSSRRTAARPSTAGIEILTIANYDGTTTKAFISSDSGATWSEEVKLPVPDSASQLRVRITPAGYWLGWIDTADKEISFATSADGRRWHPGPKCDLAPGFGWDFDLFERSKGDAPGIYIAVLDSSKNDKGMRNLVRLAESPESGRRWPSRTLNRHVKGDYSLCQHDGGALSILFGSGKCAELIEFPPGWITTSPK